jgi:hypothetical protein
MSYGVVDIASEVIAITQKNYGRAIDRSSLSLNYREGLCPTIIAAIIEFRREHNVKSFPKNWEDANLLWFYNQLKHDGQTTKTGKASKELVTSLSKGQKRELIMTLYRYWGIV